MESALRDDCHSIGYDAPSIRKEHKTATPQRLLLPWVPFQTSDPKWISERESIALGIQRESLTYLFVAAAGYIPNAVPTRIAGRDRWRDLSPEL